MLGEKSGQIEISTSTESAWLEYREMKQNKGNDESLQQRLRKKE